MVERAVELSFADLFAMNVVDSAVTLACVSNEVGGHLVGNAVWTGIPLVDVLELAGPTEPAEQVMAWSVDSFSAGFSAFGARWRSNRTCCLRNEWGAPSVPAWFSSSSGGRWAVRLRLGSQSGWSGSSFTAMDADGYWIPRGWAKEAPIKIASRIDVPLQSQTTPGVQAVAGVAWAPVVGVAEVEAGHRRRPVAALSIGGGVQVPVGMGEAWVQWFTHWDAEPGLHHLRVRAWDRNGVLQPPGPKHIAPDGAEGYHTRRVLVA
ncbi:MAG: hypothetical protein CM1200mP26_24070 [Acidimicrobiales bacterium]|nr:MAG: hypothetical protein CM1200mP26_24070 [Acidimicrobiales bacterium]